MNPYEAPGTRAERIPRQRWRMLIVVVAMIFAAGMIIGGVVRFYNARLETVRKMQDAMQAEHAAKAEQIRAQKAALKAESERESSAP